MASYRIDEEQLEAVREILELKYPLRVWVGRIKRFVGRYVGDEGGVHRIALSHELEPEEAEHTLLHEIFHAAQCERFGGYKPFMEAWWAEQAEVGVTPATIRGIQSGEEFPAVYQTTGMELEADEFADSFPVPAGLVRPAG